MIRAVAVAVPPSPLAVRVYVVDELGDTDRDPLVLTSPIPWSMETLVAPVVVQDNVEDWPLSIVVGLADSVAVGAAAGGGGGGGGGGATGAFFLHPPASISNSRHSMTEARLRYFCLFIYPSPPMELCVV